MSDRAGIPLLRSILFFPGLRPELHAKAVASAADAVCLDLEDAVSPGGKAEARSAATQLLRELPEERAAATFVRVNAPGTDVGREDLAALLEGPARFRGLVVPKVGGADDVRRVARLVEEAGREALLAPMIETASGLEAAEEIAHSVPRGGILVFGGVDLALELGADGSWESLLYARSRTIHAAAIGGLQAVDMPFMDLSDPKGLEEEARRARGLGFRGKLGVHPTQIATLQHVFSPTPEEVARARRVIRAGEDASLVDGRVVDRPVLEAARRLLSLAERTSTDG